MISELSYLTFFYFFCKKVIILFVFSRKTFNFATDFEKILVFNQPIKVKRL